MGDRGGREKKKRRVTVTEGGGTPGQMAAEPAGRRMASMEVNSEGQQRHDGRDKIGAWLQGSLPLRPSCFGSLAPAAMHLLRGSQSLWWSHSTPVAQFATVQCPSMLLLHLFHERRTSLYYARIGHSGGGGEAREPGLPGKPRKERADQAMRRRKRKPKKNYKIFYHCLNKIE